MTEVYLDIETTGLSPDACSITVVGLFYVNNFHEELVQLVGEQITAQSIVKAVGGVDTIFTYNGQRFDLPFIHQCTGIDLVKHCSNHHDLMFDCWGNNLYGGLKKVEVQLGIKRQIEGIGGLEAVLLWQRYQQYDDLKALDTLLKYNAEDVINLRLLREKLALLKKPGWASPQT